MRWSHHPDEDKLDRLIQTGRDPYDDFLDDDAQEVIRRERLAEMAPVAAYVEQPSPRERREHFDETRARALSRVRTGNVEVQPLLPPCTCGQAGLGVGPGHMYRCTRYAKNVERQAA